MSQQMRRALQQLSDSIDRNLPQVEAKLCNAGISTDRPPVALVYSVAKYYFALNKLADK
jgi:hypothetical protein